MGSGGDRTGGEDLAGHAPSAPPRHPRALALPRAARVAPLAWGGRRRRIPEKVRGKVPATVSDWCSGKHFKHRFALKRFNEIMGKLKPEQRDFIIKHGFGTLLEYRDFTVHAKLTEWIMTRIDPDICEFRHTSGRVIVFDKHLVQKVLGVPSGEVPVALKGKSEGVGELKKMYKGEEGRLFIERCAHLLLNYQDEENFMRTFFLFALATVYCPGTGNYVNLDYLHSLTDISKIKEYDWSTHILEQLMEEVKKYQGFSPERRLRDFLVGECLPILTIAYMDHLELPKGRIKDHEVNYSLPRFCHVSNADFQWVASVDRNRLNLDNLSYGSRNFRDEAEIPYYCETNEEEIHIHEPLALVEWVGMSGESMQQIPPYIKAIVDKYDHIWAKDIETATEAFTKSMKQLHASRTAAMMSEILEAKAAVDGDSDILLNPVTPPSNDVQHADVVEKDVVKSPQQAQQEGGAQKDHAKSPLQAHQKNIPSRGWPAVTDHTFSRFVTDFARSPARATNPKANTATGDLHPKDSATPPAASPSSPPAASPSSPPAPAPSSPPAPAPSAPPAAPPSAPPAAPPSVPPAAPPSSSPAPAPPAAPPYAPPAALPSSPPLAGVAEPNGVLIEVSSSLRGTHEKKNMKKRANKDIYEIGGNSEEGFDDAEYDEDVIRIPPVVPFVGMEFDSIDEAGKAYKDYALSLGFGTRVGSSRSSRVSKELIRKEFECIHSRKSAEETEDSATHDGSVSTPTTSATKKKRKRRKVEKHDCKAHMAVGLRDGRWRVIVFQAEHTHPMMKRVVCKRYYLTQRWITSNDAAMLNNVTTVCCKLSDVLGQATWDLPVNQGAEHHQQGSSAQVTPAQHLGGCQESLAQDSSSHGILVGVDHQQGNQQLQQQPTVLDTSPGGPISSVEAALALTQL